MSERVMGQTLEFLFSHLFDIVIIILLVMIERRISEQTKFLRDEDQINNIGDGL